MERVGTIYRNTAARSHVVFSPTSNVIHRWGSLTGRLRIGLQLAFFQKGIRLLSHYRFTFIAGRPGVWATIFNDFYYCIR